MPTPADQGPSPHEQAPDFDPNRVLADIARGLEIDPNVTDEFADIYPELAGVDLDALQAMGPEASRSASDSTTDVAPAIEMAEPDDPDQTPRQEQRRPAKPPVMGKGGEDAAIRAARARVLAERRRIELAGGDADDMGYKLD